MRAEQSGCLQALSQQDRTGHILTGQIPGMLGGGCGFSVEAVSLNTLRNVNLPCLNIGVYAVLVFLEKLVSMGWSSFSGKQLNF